MGSITVVMTSLVGGASLRTPASYEEYLSLGEVRHHEYFDGMVIVNPPGRRHILAVKWLARFLDELCPPGMTTYPEWGWHLGDTTDVEPDLMVAGLDDPGEDQLRVAPLLVVEVESPSTRDLDRGRKVELYAQGGAIWCWRVELDAPAVVIHQASAGELVEVQRIVAGGAETVGPFRAFLDPARMLG